jgi:hypothetical protein
MSRYTARAAVDGKGRISKDVGELAGGRCAA